LFSNFAVSIQEPVEIREIPAISLAIPVVHVTVVISLIRIGVVTVVVPVVNIFVPHEGVRVLPQLFANSRVIPEKIAQWRMAVHKFPFIKQRGIFANLFCDFAVFVQELIEIRQVLAIGGSIPGISVAISRAGVAVWSGRITVAGDAVVIVTILQTHEFVRALTYLLFHARMFLEVGVQFGMSLQIFRVID
jgi:hypothetical protein